MKPVPEQLVLITLGTQVLALTREEFNAALERARSLFPTIPEHRGGTEKSGPERWLTAEEMEKETSVPASWWAEQARRNAIPFLKAGKYPRFLLSACGEALRVRPDANDRRTRLFESEAWLRSPP